MYSNLLYVYAGFVADFYNIDIGVELDFNGGGISVASNLIAIFFFGKLRCQMEKFRNSKEILKAIIMLLANVADRYRAIGIGLTV